VIEEDQDTYYSVAYIKGNQEVEIKLSYDFDKIEIFVNDKFKREIKGSVHVSKFMLQFLNDEEEV
jgi:hypothetical protein